MFQMKHPFLKIFGFQLEKKDEKGFLQKKEPIFIKSFFRN
jgi:hypothetical protein